ncbi:hypothetical protein ACP70R_033951 [Stipagrostis hirtigluma subsp. patula]
MAVDKCEPPALRGSVQAVYILEPPALRGSMQAVWNRRD